MLRLNSEKKREVFFFFGMSYTSELFTRNVLCQKSYCLSLQRALTFFTPYSLFFLYPYSLKIKTKFKKEHPLQYKPFQFHNQVLNQQNNLISAIIPLEVTKVPWKSSSHHCQKRPQVQNRTPFNRHFRLIFILGLLLCHQNRKRNHLPPGLFSQQQKEKSILQKVHKKGQKSSCFNTTMCAQSSVPESHCSSCKPCWFMTAVSAVSISWVQCSL